MEKKLQLLIYEKDEQLNLIFKEQFLTFKKYNINIVTDQTRLFEIVKEIQFYCCILHLNDLDSSVKSFIKNFEKINNHKNIIGYYNKNLENLSSYEDQITLLKKPFRLISLFEKLENINNKKIKNEKFLMKNLVFIPIEKIIINMKTSKKEHLTEKETKLLNYLYIKKNIEISKKDLLLDIWGLIEDVNTHTLETHIYRLKQKLNKLNTNLNFSLTNINGFYCMRYK